MNNTAAVGDSLQEHKVDLQVGQLAGVAASLDAPEAGGAGHGGQHDFGCSAVDRPPPLHPNACLLHPPFACVAL